MSRGGRPARSTPRRASRHEDGSSSRSRTDRSSPASRLASPCSIRTYQNADTVVGGGRLGARPDAPAVRGRRVRRRVDGRHGRRAAPVPRSDRLPPAGELRSRGRRSTEALRRRAATSSSCSTRTTSSSRERLEALSELATLRPDLDIVTTDAAWESDGRIVGRFNSEANPFEVDNQRAAILERCFIVAPGVRRSAVLGVGGQDTGLEVSADWDCWIRMILGGSKAGSVDEPLLVYRLRRGKRQLRPAHVVPAPRLHARTPAYESSAPGRRPHGARRGSRTPSAEPSRSPRLSTPPTVATGTHASWRSPLPATGSTGGRRG